MNINKAKMYLKTLSIFKDEIVLERLGRGLSNYSFLLNNNKKKFVVKFLNDLKLFHTTHIQEVAANNAAYEVGIAPKIMYHDKKVIIFEYIQSQSLTVEEIKEKKILKHLIYSLKIIHKKIPLYFRGPAMITWNFHSIRDYVRILTKMNSLHIDKLKIYIKDVNIFENISSPFEIVFTHGDFFLSNILNDGKKLWFIDWEFSGFNSPLNDLANIAKHGKLNPEEENFILEQYYKDSFSSKLMCQLNIIKCASIIREILWSMIAEIKLPIDYDFNNYTHKTLEKYKIQLDSFKSIYL